LCDTALSPTHVGLHFYLSLNQVPLRRWKNSSTSRLVDRLVDDCSTTTTVDSGSSSGYNHASSSIYLTGRCLVAVCRPFLKPRSSLAVPQNHYFGPDSRPLLLADFQFVSYFKTIGAAGGSATSHLAYFWFSFDTFNLPTGAVIPLRPPFCVYYRIFYLSQRGQHDQWGLVPHIAGSAVREC
jgi:hypothetical protein